MPHLTIEYTRNLSGFDAGGALLALNKALADSGHINNEADIKSRAIPLDTFRVGTAEEKRAFIHVKLALLSGRPAQTKRAIAEMLLAALEGVAKGAADCHAQFCVEILELDRDTYSKSIHAP